jgi:hypothetical protein
MRHTLPGRVSAARTRPPSPFQYAGEQRLGLTFSTRANTMNSANSSGRSPAPRRAHNRAIAHMTWGPVMTWVLRNSLGEISGQPWDSIDLAQDEATKQIARCRGAGFTVRFKDNLPGRALIYAKPQDTDPIQHIRIQDENGQEVDIPVQ